MKRYTQLGKDLWGLEEEGRDISKSKSAYN